MIIEPTFPTSFTTLIRTIVSRQIAVDKAKGRISSSQGKTLFEAIDYLKVGQIFLQDLYAFLKKKGLILSKRQLKFINRYFGFSSHQKLNFLLFKQKVLSPQTKHSQFEKEIEDYQQLFVDLVKLSVDSYNQIEKLRFLISENVDQLEDCFKLYYPQSPKSITKPILQEILAVMGLYSRLAYALLSKYIIGDQAQQVTIRQLFWNPSLSPETSYQESKTIQKAHTQVSDLTERPKHILNKNLNLKNLDILAQIENIQASIRQKQQKNSIKRHVFQDFQNTPAKKQEKMLLNNLVQRSSQGNLSSYFAKQASKTNRISKFKKNQVSDYVSNKKQKDNLQEILKRSLKSYEECDPIEERQAQIEELMKVRAKSKTREEVVSRASSAAKLKIQQIEKRVFSKSKIMPSAIQNSASKTPTNLIINYQSKARNTSLKRR